MSTEPGTGDEVADIDPRDNAEVRRVQESGSRENARASDGGPIPSPAPAAGDTFGLADEAADGTGAGNPIAGVEIEPEDAARAARDTDG